MGTHLNGDGDFLDTVQNATVAFFFFSNSRTHQIAKEKDRRGKRISRILEIIYFFFPPGKKENIVRNCKFLWLAV